MCEFQVWTNKSFVEMTEVVDTDIWDVSSDSFKDPICCVDLFVNVSWSKLSLLIIDGNS